MENPLEGKRITTASEDELKGFKNLSDEEKFEFLKENYKQRDSKDKYATSQDHNLRELEIGRIKKYITGEGKLLDVGCGNGYTVLSIASEFAGLDIVAVDFSENLIEGANYLLNEDKESIKSKVEFVCEDAIKYMKEQESDSVDYLISERFVLNMPSIEIQKEIVSEAYRILKKDGLYLMCEASQDGFDALNKLRADVGLDIILDQSVTNVSSRKLDDTTFEAQFRDLGFELLEKDGFSDYFLISRVFQPLFIHPEQPKFDSKMNDLARLVQEKSGADFKLGANVLWVLKK